jgi:DNA uptake protein ComE-like DNA-binding protein
MKRRTYRMLFCLALLSAGVGAVAGIQAQVGKSLGVVDANVAPERDLAALPGMTAAIAKSVVDKRPFASITELNAHLLAQGLTAAQTAEIYKKAFVHVNLNTGTREEILLIPGAGNRMAREFPEYRPWRTWAQFDREISKYVGQPATDGLKQYVFIPLNVNTASDADLMTIPGVTAATVAQIKAARPVASKEQFEQKVGAAASAKEAARLWRFFVLQ